MSRPRYSVTHLLVPGSPGLPGVLVALLLVLVPSPGAGQGVGPLLEAIRQGGSWVNIPIEDGRGSVETAEVPTFGLELAGCARVWSGHSGTWTVEAADLVADRTLTAVLDPDEAVRFRHRSGPRSRLSVDVRWSEPRDTTLFLWVGLGGEERRRGDACAPPTPMER